VGWIDVSDGGLGEEFEWFILPSLT